MKKFRMYAFALSAIAIISITSSCRKDPQGGEDPYVPPTPHNQTNDLSSNGTANCYIVSNAGGYRFKAVKGNSTESVGAVAIVEVIWETFGTDTAPTKGDLVKSVSYSDGYIVFHTADTFKKGNALIAAKDASNKILWSWHIWMTDKPEEQKYYNDAGTMLDRNLGATSATAGEVGALGLMYEWGRKDPFLGSASITENKLAASTITWPEAVVSDASNGTIAYAQEHPTTFITKNDNNNDWCYAEDASTDNTRWESVKTIYDPCPPGYRVPEGGSDGVWAKAIGSQTLSAESLYNATTVGYNFSGKLGDAANIWYPLSGYLAKKDGQLMGVSVYGRSRSVTPYADASYSFDLTNSSIGSTPYSYSGGQPVRCCKESPDDVFKTTKDLSVNGTSNCYIVSKAGSYKFPAVRGNTMTSSGNRTSAKVLWESFGTDTAPKEGDLVRNVTYSKDYIFFQTAETFKEGNAVIALTNPSGQILWSYHIWLTDEPQDQVYYKNAGIMMDRNLGATSATPGDVGALGLLYQWGRKDPFLGGSAISYESDQNQQRAASTITWPDAVTSTSTTGTINYTIANPTTFITFNSQLKKK